MSEQELNQIKEIQKRQLGGMFVSAENVAAVFKALVESIKTTRATLQKELETGDSKNLDKCISLYKELETSISDCEKRLTSLISSSSKETLSEAYKAIKDEVKGIKDSIKGFDASYLEKKIAEVEGMIPEIKDAVSDTPEEVRDKLESLVDEDRLDWKAVQGVVGIHIGSKPPEDKEMLWVQTLR